MTSRSRFFPTIARSLSAILQRGSQADTAQRLAGEVSLAYETFRRTSIAYPSMHHDVWLTAQIVLFDAKAVRGLPPFWSGQDAVQEDHPMLNAPLVADQMQHSSSEFAASDPFDRGNGSYGDRNTPSGLRAKPSHTLELMDTTA